MYKFILFISRKIYHKIPLTLIKKIILSIFIFYRRYQNQKIKQVFPIGSSGKSLVGDFFFKKGKYGYIGLPYKESLSPNCNDKTVAYMLKCEILKVLKSNSYESFYSEKSLLPISIINSKSFFDKKSVHNIKITINDKKHLIKMLPQNRYSYLNIEANSKVKIESKDTLLIGKSLSLEQKKKQKKKLVLVLFFDALTGSIINKNLDSLMSNTANFFNSGIKFNNCYSNSEYTYTSLASIFSGKYLHNINFMNSRREEILGEKFPLISELFQENNFFTTLISGNTSQSPNLGYAKGFDRTIYKNCLKFNEIIDEFFESNETFSSRDQFVWLSFLDTHHLIDHVPSIDVQKDFSIEEYDYSLPGLDLKTPFGLFCPRETSRYTRNLTKIDKELKRLYSYLDNNYNKEDYSVVLLSDHANSSTLDIEHTSHIQRLLKREKLNVPLLVKDVSLTPKISNSLIENVDIFPILLSLAGINYELNLLDGKLPKEFGGNEREFIFSESIYPNQTYKATIKNQVNEFFLESQFYTSPDGKISLGNYKTFSLNDKNEQVENIFNEKVIISKIKHLLEVQ